MTCLQVYIYLVLEDIKINKDIYKQYLDLSHVLLLIKQKECCEILGYLFNFLRNVIQNKNNF